MPWIEHPATENPVSWARWIKYWLACRLERLARRLEVEALYPNCEACGKPRTRGDHMKCDEVPF